MTLLHAATNGLALLAFLLAPTTRAQADLDVELLVDLNTTPVPRDGVQGFRPSIAEVNGELVFTGWTPETGAELFHQRLGLPAELFLDVWQGQLSSAPVLGPQVQGLLYFTAHIQEIGERLCWTFLNTPLPGYGITELVGFGESDPEVLTSFTDAAGYQWLILRVTQADGVRSLRAGNVIGDSWVDLGPTDAWHSVTLYNGALVFTASDGIWRWDGFGTSPVQLAQLDYGGIPMHVPSTLEYKGELYLTVMDGARIQLWKTAGVAGDGQLVQDMWGGLLHIANGFGKLVTDGERLYFPASTGPTGAEVFAWDGVSAQAITDINPPFGTLAPLQLFLHGQDLYFTVRYDSPGLPAELWKATTTPFTEQLLADLSPVGGSSIQGFHAEGGWVHFVAYTGQDWEPGLWRTDGTAAGTGPTPGLVAVAGSAPPSEIFELPSGLYVALNDAAVGREWFRIAGGVATLLNDTAPGTTSASSAPGPMSAVLGSELLFGATSDGTGREPHRVNAQGAFERLADVNPTGDSDPTDFVAGWNGSEVVTYFMANDGIHGRELWRHDASGASLVADLTPGPDDSEVLWPTLVAGRLYFVLYGDGEQALWTTDGSASGTLNLSPPELTFPLASQLTAIGDAVYVAHRDSLSIGRIWRAQGTTFEPFGPALYGAEGLRRFGRKLVFTDTSSLDPSNSNRLVVLDTLDGHLRSWVLPSGYSFKTQESFDNEFLQARPAARFGERYAFIVKEPKGTEGVASMDPKTGDFRLHYGSPFVGSPLPVSKVVDLAATDERLYFVLETPGGHELFGATEASFSGSKLVDLTLEGSSSPELLGTAGSYVYFRATQADDYGLRDELLRFGPAGLEVASELQTGQQDWGHVHHADPSPVTRYQGGVVLAMSDPFDHGREPFRMAEAGALHIDGGLEGSAGVLEVGVPHMGQWVEARFETLVPGAPAWLVFGAPAPPSTFKGLADLDAIGLEPMVWLGPHADSAWGLSLFVPPAPSLLGNALAAQVALHDLGAGPSPWHTSNRVLLILGP